MFREEELAATAPATPPDLQHLMTFIPPSMLVFVTLKYQTKPDTLFLHNPFPLWCYIASTCVYWLIAGFRDKLIRTRESFRESSRRAVIATGVLSSLSLLSIFLPYPFSLPPLVIWGSFSTLWVLWPLRPHVYDLVRKGAASVVTVFQALVVLAGGGGDAAVEEASSPV